MSPLPSFRYIAISEQSVCPEPIPQRISRLFQLGVPAVQLRDKSVSDHTRLGWGQKLNKNGDHTLIMNGRADMALLGECDGVHLPQRGLSQTVVRRLIHDDGLVGRSTHRREDVLNAEALGADYVTFGPVYPTPSKPNLTSENIPGPNGLETVCEMTSIPVFALGGINSTKRARECLDAGAYGLSGIRLLFETDNPKAEWKKLNTFMD